MLSLSKHGTADRKFPCLDVSAVVCRQALMQRPPEQPNVEAPEVRGWFSYASPLAEDGALATSCRACRSMGPPAARPRLDVSMPFPCLDVSAVVCRQALIQRPREQPNVEAPEVRGWFSYVSPLAEDGALVTSC
ncbi:MAG: hypothetical protein AMXMBFR61_12870 [Fimbriimonadales bacterium]